MEVCCPIYGWSAVRSMSAILRFHAAAAGCGVTSPFAVKRTGLVDASLERHPHRLCQIEARAGDVQRKGASNTLPVG